MSEEERKADAVSAPAGEAANDAPSARKGGMSVFLYIAMLFGAALLLMCLSSLVHQRDNAELLGKNTEALGELRNSVSVMQEVQNLQDKIIKLQEDLRGLEAELKQAQGGQAEASEQAEAERKRADALACLYAIEAEYQTGRYQACQGSIEAFAASGLVESLPTEAPEGGVASPLERYRQLQDAVLARLSPPTVGMPPQNP